MNPRKARVELLVDPDEVIVDEAKLIVAVSLAVGLALN